MDSNPQTFLSLLILRLVRIAIRRAPVGHTLRRRLRVCEAALTCDSGYFALLDGRPGYAPNGIVPWGNADLRHPLVSMAGEQCLDRGEPTFQTRVLSTDTEGGHSERYPPGVTTFTLTVTHEAPEARCRASGA